MINSGQIDDQHSRRILDGYCNWAELVEKPTSVIVHEVFEERRHNCSEEAKLEDIVVGCRKWPDYIDSEADHTVAVVHMEAVVGIGFVGRKVAGCMEVVDSVEVVDYIPAGGKAAEVSSRRLDFAPSKN